MRLTYVGTRCVAEFFVFTSGKMLKGSCKPT